jgi:cytoskeletal protein RodZ
MNEKLLKKLIRQVKILNFFIASFGFLVLISIGIVVFLLWQTITFVQGVNQKLQNVSQQVKETRQSLNVKNQACEDSAIGNFLKKNSQFCK